MDKREGNAGRVKGLAGEVSHDDRIFAAGKQQGRLFELGCGFAKNEDRLRFQLSEVVDSV